MTAFLCPGGKPQRWVVAVVALVVGCVSLPARAGQLDRGLLKRGGDVLVQLHKKGYRNVGVLPFEVVKGTRKASLTNSRLALELPARLENVLVLWQHPDGKVIGVIRGAAGLGSVPADKDAFDALFARKYPLAWGEKKVEADAFLTGRVINKGDRATTTVIVEAFDRKSWQGGKLVKSKVCEFDISTDRPLLSDLGYPWASRGLRPVPDREAVQRVAEAETKEGVVPSPDDVAGFKFEVFYNGKKQKIAKLAPPSESQKDLLPLYQLPPMPRVNGKEVEIVMVPTRLDKSKGTLGVVVKVNGQSTNSWEDRPGILCRKWLFEKGDKSDKIEGFYTPSKTKKGEYDVFPFKSLTNEQYRGKRSERLGWIDVEVFGSNPKPKKPRVKKVDDEENAVALVSTSSVGRQRDGAVVASRSLADLQKALRRANNVSLEPIMLPENPKDLPPIRALIDAELVPRGTVIVQHKKFPNPEFLGSISIRYTDGKP